MNNWLTVGKERPINGVAYEVGWLRGDSVFTAAEHFFCQASQWFDAKSKPVESPHFFRPPTMNTADEKLSAAIERLNEAAAIFAAVLGPVNPPTRKDDPLLAYYREKLAERQAQVDDLWPPSREEMRARVETTYAAFLKACDAVRATYGGNR